MSDCWDTTLRSELTQGDLLQSILVGTAARPKTPLRKGFTKDGGASSWLESDKWVEAGGNGLGYFLGHGVHTDVLVLSESCEIDKANGTTPILVAPVIPMTTIQDAAMREYVAAGRRYAFMPLDALSGLLGESYADLRRTCHIRREFANDAHLAKKLSMTDRGIERLKAQIVGFYTRIDLNDIKRQ